MPHWGEFFIFWKWLHSGIQEYFASSVIFFLGASCHLILRKPRQGYTFLLLSYCSFPINFWASRPKALFWGIGCQLGNSEDNCCCQVLRKSGPFSTLSVPPKLLRENLAHDSNGRHSTVEKSILWRSDRVRKEDTCHSQDVHIVIYFTQCKMTHQTLSSVIQKQVGNEDNKQQ